MNRRSFVLWGVLILLPVLVIADNWRDLENRVVEHELENGMRFLILERHQSPLVSMVITVKAGSVNEVTNKTGLAHFLEHLAFKGTKTIGTTDYKKEQKALEELDASFQAYHRAVQDGADSAAVAELYAEFKRIQEKASDYVVQGEFSNIYERNGGFRLNASTSDDYTRYYVTLPSNCFELWCAMESDRLANPVFREFYKERDVILAERRMRYDDRPSGLFYEDFNAIAYKAHPYGQPTIGHLSDMQNLSRKDVRIFYETYYVPQNITAAIVGDVETEEIIPLLEAYFGRIPARPDPPGLITVEPAQKGVRRVEMKFGQTPEMVMEFRTVPTGHPDEIKLDLLSHVIGRGRASRLYRNLVEEKELASRIYSYHDSRLYMGSFGFSVVPMEGHTPQELEQAVLDVLTSLKDNPVSQAELDAARIRWKVMMYDLLSNNLRMAFQLASSDRGNRGWKSCFEQLTEAEEVTVDDLMEVAERYFDFERRTVGFLEVEND